MCVLDKFTIILYYLIAMPIKYTFGLIKNSHPVVVNFSRAKRAPPYHLFYPGAQSTLSHSTYDQNLIFIVCILHNAN